MRWYHSKDPAFVPALVLPGLPWAAKPTDELAKRALNIISGRHSKNVEYDYVCKSALWIEWCVANDQCPLPADDFQLCRFYTEMHENGTNFPKLVRLQTAINALHYSNGMTRVPSGIIHALFRTLRKEHKVKRKTPLTVEQVYLMCEHARQTRTPLAAGRDIAIFTNLFASAERCSEWVNAVVGDLTFHQRGLHISIPKSKGDQKGEGQAVRIGRMRDTSRCPVAALHRWLTMANITDGYVFREINRWGHIGLKFTYPSINRLIQTYTRELGFEGDFATYSFRRGWGHASRARGVAESVQQAHLRHKDRSTTLLYTGESGQPLSWDEAVALSSQVLS